MNNTSKTNQKTNTIEQLKRCMVDQGAIIVHQDKNIMTIIARCLEKTK